MSRAATDKPKITDVQIRAWISSKTHFEFKTVETNLFLVFPERFTVPVFKFRYRMGRGKKREIITIGAYGKVSLSVARKLSQQYNGQIANGQSPKMELLKRKEEAARDENPFTVEKLTARYFDKRVLTRPNKKPLKNPDQKKWQLNRINAALGKMPVDAVTSLHIADMLDADFERGCPASTNKLLETTRQVFKYAAARKIIKENPAKYLSIKDAGAEQEARDRKLSRSELVTLFKEMETAAGFGRDNYLIVKLLLILCVRKSELTKAQKSEFNLDCAIWTLEKQRTKTKVAIEIPLPAQAIEALQELFTRSGESAYLLPARKPQSRGLPHISDATLNKALEKITNISDFTVHDLRRTAKTRLQDLGVDEFISERCLNHAIKGVYGRHDFFEERKQALQLWANYLEACETGQDWNVIPIRKKA